MNHVNIKPNHINIADENFGHNCKRRTHCYSRKQNFLCDNNYYISVKLFGKIIFNYKQM